MKKILIINGPNLNMLGLREPEIYGRATYDDLVGFIRSRCGEAAELEFYQSNHEGALIDRIQAARGVFDGIVLNAGGYTHTSVALRDAVAACGVPTAEVHISDVMKRESFRHFSFLTDVCVITVAGKGFESYTEAIGFLLRDGEGARA